MQNACHGICGGGKSPGSGTQGNLRGQLQITVRFHYRLNIDLREPFTRARACCKIRLIRKMEPAERMKTRFAILALVLSLFAFRAAAQNYSIDWYKISGGGGTSTGGTFAVSGTIGQPDAGVAMSGGNYSVTGGFWALFQVVQTPGAPTLYISRNGNGMSVYWQAVSGWSLHQSGNLATPIGNWSASAAPTQNNGTNYVNITNPTGNVFFRLTNP